MGISYEMCGRCKMSRSACERRLSAGQRNKTNRAKKKIVWPISLDRVHGSSRRVDRSLPIQIWGDDWKVDIWSTFMCLDGSLLLERMAQWHVTHSLRSACDFSIRRAAGNRTLSHLMPPTRRMGPAGVTLSEIYSLIIACSAPHIIIIIIQC